MTDQVAMRCLNSELCSYYICTGASVANMVFRRTVSHFSLRKKQAITLE